MIKNKIKNLKEIEVIAARLRKINKKIVTTNGVFDLLHAGHVAYLEKAKALGDVLMVGINSDSSVKQNKGDKRPINGERARLIVMASLESVDYVFLFSEKDPKSWLEKIKPDIHVKAADYKLNQIIEKEPVEKNGGKITLIALEKGFSTTKTIEKILKIFS